MENTQEKTELFKAIESLLNDNKQFDFLSAYDLTDERYAPDSDTDSIHEYITERISEQEVIYYTKAIEYLKENDPSLCDSLALAAEYGCNLDDLNSEKLATILMQENLRNEAYKLAEKLVEIFEEHKKEEE